MVHEIIYADSDLDNQIKAFEKLHPNIQVTTDFVAYGQLHDKIVTDQVGGSGTYDLVVMDNIWPAEFSSANLVRKLNGRIPQSYVKGSFPLVWKSVSYKGGIYGVPWGGIATKFLFYNKKMFAKAGIKGAPKTWDQVAADAKILKAKGIVKYPYVASWAQSESLVSDWAQMAGAFGAKSLMTPSGTATFASGGGLKALTFMRKLYAEGLANPASLSDDFDQINNTMSSGQAAIALQWAYGISAMDDPKSSKVPGQIAFEVSPGEGKVKTAGVDGDIGLAVTAHSSHPAEALELALYLSSKPLQDKYASWAPPMWTASYKEKSITKSDPPLFADTALAAHYLVERPQVPYYTSLSNALQVAIQKAIQGQQTPKAALDSVVAQIPKLKNG
jgi:multiple sugar transport system substrate-binding protein